MTDWATVTDEVWDAFEADANTTGLRDYVRAIEEKVRAFEAHSRTLRLRLTSGKHVLEVHTFHEAAVGQVTTEDMSVVFLTSERNAGKRGLEMSPSEFERLARMFVAVVDARLAGKGA